MSEALFRYWSFFRRSPFLAIRAAANRLAQTVRTLFTEPSSRSGLGASLYYTLLSRRFQREQRAVLAGQHAFRQINPALALSLPELRRNIHRLEKGLSMRPRRDVFAEGYIGRTVAVVESAMSGGLLDNAEATWASDVLDAVFDALRDTPRIAAARTAWHAARTAAEVSTHPKAHGGCVPYLASQRQSAGISPEALMTLLRERRSVRWYEDRGVEPGLIERAIDAASLAASACNRQPYRFVVLTNPERARAAAALAGGTAGWGHQIPALVVVLGDLSCYPHERDRHVPYIDASLAVAQMLLSLQTLGLSSCAINWPEVEERDMAMQNLLGLAPYQRVIMLVAVGYADPNGLVPWSQKKSRHVLTVTDAEEDMR